jgi:hypothetical protein
MHLSRGRSTGMYVNILMSDQSLRYLPSTGSEVRAGRLTQRKLHNNRSGKPKVSDMDAREHRWTLTKSWQGCRARKMYDDHGRLVCSLKTRAMCKNRDVNQSGCSNAVQHNEDLCGSTSLFNQPSHVLDMWILVGIS